jgi:hypothetical protein
MTQRITRDVFERRFHARREADTLYNKNVGQLRQQMIASALQETEKYAVSRRNAKRQKIADEEFLMAEKLYNKEMAARSAKVEREEQDAIAAALHEQKLAEVRDKTYRGVLCERDPEYRELKSKLHLALVKQTRHEQIEDKRRRERMENDDRILDERVMLREIKQKEEQRAAEDDMKHADRIATMKYIQDQINDNERRRRLLEIVDAEKARGDVDAVVEKIRTEDNVRTREIEDQKATQRRERDDFLAVREAEEEWQMDAFRASVDDRLLKNMEEQWLCDDHKEILGQEMRTASARRT